MTVVINPNVHIDSTLDRRRFLERLSGVEAVRTNRNSYDEGLTIYIHSVESFNYYQHLKSAICGGDFCGLNGRYRVRHFGIDVADPLFMWFEHCDLSVIQRQVVCWLTALYAKSPTNRHVMEEQIYPPIMTEIIHLYKSFYHGKADYDSEELDIKSIYKSACLHYYNSVPPEILSCPGSLQFNQEVIEQWRVRDTFDIQISRFWFRESDWQRVVVEEVDDNMLRAESSREYFLQWKHQFSAYDNHKKHVYGLFDTEPSGGFIYIIEEHGTGNFKIGFTSNHDVEQRRASLQTGNSNELSVRGSFPCASRSTEKLLHRMFSEFRALGEWFSLRTEQVENILDEHWRTKNQIF